MTFFNRCISTLLCTITLIAMTSLPSLSQGLIRDAEIERTLRLIAKPILQQAGLSSGSVRLYILDDNRMNAFVAGGNNIFIHSGMIRRLDTVEMLQSIIAHELGHNTGGHLAQRSLGIGSANTAAGLGLLLSLAAAAAGNADAAIGIAAGSTSAAQRKFLAFTRGQESSADQSGARYLSAAGIDPQAAIDVLNLFKGQEALSSARRDPYTVTHPLSGQRIDDLRARVAGFKPRPSKQPANIEYWFNRMKTKFDGYQGSPRKNLRSLKKSDKGEMATLLRTLAYFRTPKPKLAVQQANRLIKMRPKDPYYHELRGQILIETGNPAAAAKSYARAVALSPKEPHFLAGLGRAQLASTKGPNKKALATLKRAYSRDPRDARMLRDLAVAYARTGSNGMASIVTAERYALNGNFKQAGIHARRAENLLPRGSSGWLKAQDILVLSKRYAKKK